MVEKQPKTIRFTQPQNKKPIKYVEFLSVKDLPCNRVFDEYVIKGNFVERPQDSIR